MLGPAVQCKITGLVKDAAKPYFSIGREKIRQMRAEMHLHAIGGIPKKYTTIASIRGWLAFAKGVDTNAYKNLKSYGEKLKVKYQISDNVPWF